MTFEPRQRRRMNFSLHTLLATMMFVGLGFAAWHNRLGIGGPLWGPVYLIIDSDPQFQIEGWFVLLGCAAGLLAGVCWFPRPWALAVAFVAIAIWIFYGIVGSGIGR